MELKPIVAIEFSEQCALAEAQTTYNEFRSTIPKEYCVIGYYKPFVNIRQITGDTAIVFLDGNSFTADDILSLTKKQDASPEEKDVVDEATV